MDLAEKLERSHSSEKIDFSKIACLHHPDRLVKVASSDLILVKPVWEIPGDYEGALYATYRERHPEYDGVYVRSAVLQRLEEAAKSFNGTYKLTLHAGHRPIGVQKQLLQDVMHDYQKAHPAASDDEALAHARMYVSDPAIKLPPHCCGAAVDVALFNTATNAYVDFGSTMNEDSDVSHLHSDAINEQQKENRLLLLNAMLGAGFASYYAEWWHYSYGDEIWAWFYHKDACLYGLTEK
jgi:D-alanyl-D-alanine dipeptidase